MGQKYTESAMRVIVEVKTNHEYSLLNIEKKGRINELTGECEKRKMTIKHECGHEYTLDIYEFAEGKRRCGKCKGKVLKGYFTESIEVIKAETEDLTNGDYSFIDNTYDGSKCEHWFIHHACGEKFEKKWEKFKIGQRCTHCQRKGMESMASRYVRDILDHFSIEYECEKRYEDCINPKTNMVLPFDYYLPAINLIIEVDGEQHERNSFGNWDSEGCIERDKIKNNYLKEKGIELVRIPAKEWTKIPNFLHDILSKVLQRTVTLEEAQAVPQSTHPERINEDLKKYHNGEYALYDKFYTGTDRKHEYIHLTCKKVFPHTFSRIKDEKYPCPDCRDGYIQLQKHKASNKLLIEKSNGRYSLDDSIIGTDEGNRRLIRCNDCKKSWPSIVTNIIQDKGGCPNCKNIKDITDWREKYYIIVNKLKLGEKLDKNLMQWVYWNKRKYAEGKLTKWRLRLLRRDGLI